MPKTRNRTLHKVTPRELTLLQDAISASKKRNQEHEISMEKDVVEIFSTVLSFIKSKRVLCYGGTAINAALDEEDKFYDETFDLPDYDFFSTKALDHAKELSNVFARKGYVVNAKAGQHHGTYKVFVNFLPVADITQCDPRIFTRLWKQRFIKKGVGYVPPHFLKWSMYTELSRPMGDVARWEKVYTRLKLLEKRFPLDKDKCGTTSNAAAIYRPFVSHQYSAEDLHVDLKRTLAEEGVIFFGFGAFAEYMYAYKRQARPVAIDFEVIGVEYVSCANAVKANLIKQGYHRYVDAQREHRRVYAELLRGAPREGGDSAHLRQRGVLLVQCSRGQAVGAQAPNRDGGDSPQFLLYLSLRRRPLQQRESRHLHGARAARTPAEAPSRDERPAASVHHRVSRHTKDQKGYHARKVP